MILKNFLNLDRRAVKKYALKLSFLKDFQGKVKLNFLLNEFFYD